MMNGTCKNRYVKINCETVQCLYMRYKYTISHWKGGECPVGRYLNLAGTTKSISDHIYSCLYVEIHFIQEAKQPVCCEHEGRIQDLFSKEYPFQWMNVVFIPERTLGLFRLLFLVDLVLRTRSQWRPYGPWAANVVVNCFVVYREYQMKVYQIG